MNSTNIICDNLSLIDGFNDTINDTISNDEQNNSNILKVNKVECKTNNLLTKSYKVVSYDKNMLSIDLINSHGLCRSIILNSDNKVVSFSPPKSIPSDVFINIHYPKNKDIIIAQEFIEGTMINLFWDDTIGLSGDWEISTRNTVGATSCFYKSPNSKTFRQMFFEAIKENNICFEHMNPCYSYSFVLQHPENRIVVPFKKPQLYLVAVYHIDNSDRNNICVYSMDMKEVKKFDWKNSTIKFPQIYEYEKYSDLIQQYASMNTPYYILGVVLFNSATGERAKIRNPVYEQVKNLRGNQPKLQYQYLSLRKEGKVGDCLKFYPENKKEFSTFRDQVHLFTNTLFANYVSCYIKKEKPLLEFSDQYRTHMFNIHQTYMNNLREKKLFVTNTVVINYVNNLHPSLLMFCLNFQMRKRNVDYIAVESTL